MDQKEFIETIRENIVKYVGSTSKVKIGKVRKNNGIELNSITIIENGCNVAPTIYLEHFYRRYQNGERIEDLTQEIIKVHESSKPNRTIDIDYFLDFDQIKDKISYKLINYKKNEEMLQNVPYFRFLDLAIVFYCMIEEEKLGCGMITISNEHLSMWETTKEILIECAKKRPMECKIQDLEDAMREMLISNVHREFGINEMNMNADQNDDAEEMEYLIDQMLLDMKDENKTRMYILTNEKKLNGAICMMNLEFLKSFSAAMESDLYIIPSSIHEVILVPTIGENDSGRLSKMVREVNETQVEEEEVLADHVYFYSRELNEIVCA